MNEFALTLDDLWRLHPIEFAKTVGGARFVPYRWACHVLDQVWGEVIEDGNARVIVNAPPQHGKSQALSRWFVTWYLNAFPSNSVILSSYGDTFASRWGMLVRDEFNSSEWTTTRVKPERAMASDWLTTQGGGMRSVGVGGAVTGLGADLIIVDDPHKNWEEALSDTYRQKAIDWFNAVLYTRRRPGASIVVIQTRWHERDLTGYLLAEHEDDWRLIRLPAIAEDEDDLGRKPGEALCPERYSAEQLEQIRRAVGAQIFAGLYQQRPSPIEGSMVKRASFQRYVELPVCERYIQSWDLTFKSTGTSYVVGQLWGSCNQDFYLIDQVRDKFSFLEIIDAIRAFSSRWPLATDKLVEEAANGAAVIDALKDEIAGIVPVRPRGSKEARLAAVSALIESGHVYLPKLDWVDDFIEEVVTFPHGANDDQVDAMTMALERLHNKTAVFNTSFTIPEIGLRSSPWRSINGTG